ncbi:katanin p80 WD40 repeat-containing subunit B1-like protein [Leptotrombidium deliense]|uniref:Katanin p80 WD40 repeat-containing subunit B1 n=1 Tax=Leptotrombidium deliense TaxID=299467 RepID=A0A443SBD0_9ACAR|nr:katanin p80 WD40 repeat-containing subunit B1-like protein [Leptotrombidium deliense]
MEKFVGQASSVTCLALSQKTGSLVATGGEDNKVNLWAVGNTEILVSLSGHVCTVESIKFGHNEDIICAGSASGSLKVWDLETVKCMTRTLTGHKSVISSLDFHPYGDFVASGSVDSNIKLWDIRKKGCMYTYKSHTKDVCCLKFSPDGRWLASGGEEGIVKLWDLPAGKLLAELKQHSGKVTDVCFHPNEFLLSSCSSDGTVKFWDLETFQLVSCTVNDAGPIRKIVYHPSGRVLFGAPRDVLKVYGWEPARIFDTLVINWGKVSDLAVTESKLLAATHSSTSLAVIVLDLNKVKPFGNSAPTKSYVRDCFARSLESNRSEETGVSDWEDSSGTEKSDIVNKVSDCTLGPNFLSRSTSSIVAENRYFSDLRSLDLSKSTNYSESGVPLMSTPVLPLLHSKNVASKSFTCLPLNSQHNIKQPVVSKSVTFSDSNTCVIAKVSTSVNIQPQSISQKKSTSVVQPRQSEIVSIVHPVVNDSKMSNSVTNGQSENQIHKIQAVPPNARAAVVFPEPQSRCKSPESPVELIPETRERPAGFDVDEFLPKHLQATVKLGFHPKPEMSECDAMQAIIRGHMSVVTALSHRKKNLQIVLAMWSVKDSRNALEQAVHMEDQSVIVDILNVITLKPAIWTLDMCQLLLPITYDLLRSKYESLLEV